MPEEVPPTLEVFLVAFSDPENMAISVNTVDME